MDPLAYLLHPLVAELGAPSPLHLGLDGVTHQHQGLADSVVIGGRHRLNVQLRRDGGWRSGVTSNVVPALDQTVERHRIGRRPPPSIDNLV